LQYNSSDKGQNSVRAIDNFGRVSRRKSRTREKLIVAAQSLLITKSVEKINIQDITEKADVGIGTFYNHFSSKNDLFEAVADIFFVKTMQALDEISQGLEDDAEIACYCYRFMLQQVSDKSNWSIIRQISNGCIREKLIYRARRDTQAGIESGRFNIDNLDVFVKFIPSMILGVMNDVVEGLLSSEQAEYTVIYYLRLLGINESEAIRLSELPLPTYTKVRI